MKFALLLVVCLVGMSHQQQDYWSRLLQDKALFYDPYYFSYANEPNPYRLAPAKETEGAQFRFRLRPQQKKFFSLNSAQSGFTIPVTTTTTTELATSTLTATIASVQSCVPSSLFITQLAAGGAVTLTTPCLRKRRTIDDQDLSPSQVSYVEASAPPEFAFDERPISDNYFRSSDFDVFSSQREPINEYANKFLLPNDRNNAFLQPPRTLTITSTVTRTLTAYSFGTTTFKRSVILSGPNALSCLPSGLAVC